MSSSHHSDEREKPPSRLLSRQLDLVVRSTWGYTLRLSPAGVVSHLACAKPPTVPTCGRASVGAVEESAHFHILYLLPVSAPNDEACDAWPPAGERGVNDGTELDRRRDQRGDGDEVDR
jgi:hypothetical protein